MTIAPQLIERLGAELAQSISARTMLTLRCVPGEQTAQALILDMVLSTLLGTRIAIELMRQAKPDHIEAAFEAVRRRLDNILLDSQHSVLTTPLDRRP